MALKGTLAPAPVSSVLAITKLGGGAVPVAGASFAAAFWSFRRFSADVGSAPRDDQRAIRKGPGQ